MKLFLPKYLQHDKIHDLYQQITRLTSSEPLELSFEHCVWADHFELQKLAVCLAGLPLESNTLTIHGYKDLPSDAPEALKESNEKTIEVVDYANRINFFGLLHQRFGAGLKVVCRGETFSAHTETDLQNLLSELLPVTRADTRQSRSYIPIQSLTDRKAVDRITRTFLAGDQIQELIEHHAGLDFVASGEFATLIVHELLQNTIEHAWPYQFENPVAVVSLSTVSSRRREGENSRLQFRSQYGPPYEQQFLQNLLSTGYLELCVSDNGVGITTTLGACEDKWQEWFGSRTPSDADLLAAAFWANVTRDAGPHRPGHRGLYFAFESVRENSGVLICQVMRQQLAVVCNDPDWIKRHKTNPALKPTTAHDVSDLSTNISGTHLRVLLPLISGRQRRYWWMRFASRDELFHPAERDLDLRVEAVPLAPTSDEMEADLVAAMADFRERCRGTVNKSSGSLPGFDGTVLWLSAAQTRFWTKQHIQTLLTEVLDDSSLKVISIVNLPSSQFQSFSFVARYVTALETGKLVLLQDQSGKRVIVYRQHTQLCEDFMRWAVEGAETSFDDSSNEGNLVSSFVTAFRQKYPTTTLTRLQFVAVTLGIQEEFSSRLERFRDRTSIVRLDEGCYVKGYIELDEALRSGMFLRVAASLVQLSRSFVIKPKGTIVVRRAAVRLMEHSRSLDDEDIWVMPTPAVENAPSAEWISKHSPVCIVTDVVCRGTTLSRLLSHVGLAQDTSKKSSALTIVAPLIVDLEGECATHNHNIVHSSVPGLSYLTFTSSEPIPIIWAMRSVVQTAEKADNALSPDQATNILFERPGDYLHEALGEMEPGTFIRFAEHQNALWLGHLIITGEHFDLEFNMSRLLRDGSPVLARFVDMVVRSISSIDADTIVFPDESRIQLAISAIEDALFVSGMTVPRFLRMRRSASGEMFLRKSDERAMQEAKALVFLDDAVNSGGTVRQMLAKATKLVAPNAVFSFCTVVSRQSADEALLFRDISSIEERSFKHNNLVRIPVGFFTEDDCPYCRIRDISNGLALGLGSRSQIAALLHEFADNLHPANAYERVVNRVVEPSLRYSAPVPKAGKLVSEQFATLSGAKAAVACALASKAQLDLEAFIEVLDRCQGNPLLSAYAFHVACGRHSSSASFTESPQFVERFESVCENLGNVARDEFGSANVFTDAVVDLCLTCWFVSPTKRLALLAGMIQRCHKHLIDLRIYEWWLFLCYGVSQVRGEDNAAYDQLQEAITQSRRVEALAEEPGKSSLESVERLMNLRHLAQALAGEPVSEPWLEGVIRALEILSYKAGHEWTHFVTRRDIGWATSLSEQLIDLNLDEDPQHIASTAEVPELFSDVDSFLKLSTASLAFLARSLSHSLGGWLRAVDYAGQSNFELDELLNKLHICELRASKLLEAVDHARLEFRQQRFDLLAVTLHDMAEAQQTLYTLLYEQSQHGAAIRSEVEHLLCPLYDLAGSFSTREVEEQLLNETCQLRTQGTLFEYCDQVKAPSQNKPRWSVLLAPMSLVHAILKDVVIENPRKHIIQSLDEGSTVEIRADIEGIELLDHRIRFRVTVLVNNRAWALPKELWHKTLGRNREILLHVYGGHARIEASKFGPDSSVVVEFLSGHF